MRKILGSICLQSETMKPGTIYSYHLRPMGIEFPERFPWDETKDEAPYWDGCFIGLGDTEQDAAQDAFDKLAGHDLMKPGLYAEIEQDISELDGETVSWQNFPVRRNDPIESPAYFVALYYNEAA